MHLKYICDLTKLEDRKLADHKDLIINCEY